MGSTYRPLALAAVCLWLVYCSSDEYDGGTTCEPGQCGATDSGAEASGGSGGAGANGGSSGAAAASSAAGASGTSGASGSSGAAGTSGTSGAAGTSGSSGAAGTSGSAGSVGDGGGSCPPGTATNVTGSCDLVKQDCGGGLTCRVQSLDGGSYQSACINLGTGSKQLGATCASHAECAAGTFCALAKCTRPCCAALQTELCGATGQCDMQITYGTGTGAPFVKVCTFSAPCTPWANDCPPGPESDCHVGSGGVLKCSFPNYDQDAGSTVGQPCTYLNDCGDSQQCDFASGSGVCRWLCKASAGSGAPDAGVVGGAPGSGGCLPGETCVAYSTPSWLGVCRPP